jgi:hypothetical protein
MTTLSVPKPMRAGSKPLRLSLSAPTANAALLAQAMARAAGAQLSQPTLRVAYNLAAPRPRSLEERLFDARAACKIESRKFSMLFDPDWHTRLFHQLDLLMDVQEWDPDDSPVTNDSFTTLLRLLMILRDKRRPGLGIANAGNILATWSITAGDRLTIECLPDDRVRWIVTHPVEEGTESAVGETNLDRLMANLAPYNPDHWFAHEGPKSAR